MTLDEQLEKIKELFPSDRISGYDGFIAIQFCLTDYDNHLAYIEVKDHNLSVMPYDYYDRNASITVTAADLYLILSGRLDPVLAFTTGQLKCDGDPGKFMELITLTRADAESSVT